MANPDATKRRRTVSVYEDIDVQTGIDDDYLAHDPYIGYVEIKCTDSTEWGPRALAAARALSTSTVTKENQELLRTYHPAFSGADDVLVAIFYLRDGTRMWVVWSLSCPVPCTHAGGLEIHQMPAKRIYGPRRMIYPSRNDYILHPINPRKLLSNDDLEAFRLQYPRSCGARIWLSGCIEVLYPDESALLYDYQDGVSCGVGGRAAVFGVLRCTPSRGGAMIGQNVTANPTLSTSCSLGLRLILPDGTPAITTVTHEFVRIPQPGLLRRAIDCLWLAKDTLLKFRFRSSTKVDLPYVRPCDTPTTNTPLGKDVWILGKQTCIGTITHTFDTPSQVGTYPAGYSHDLSLITGTSANALPFVDSPSGLPQISGWADVTDALEGAPLFIASNVAFTDRHDVKYGTILGRHTTNLLQSTVKQAVAEGTQYLWYSESLKQSVSLLWRCVPSPEEIVSGMQDDVVENLNRMFRPMEDLSGGVLCVGRPTDDKVEALAFQNFEVCGKIHTNEKIPIYNVKGGFLLPSYVRDNCQIDHQISGVKETVKFTTITREATREPTGRSFSGPV